MTDLHIPVLAVRAALAVSVDEKPIDLMAQLTEAAPFIVAAELRRLAADITWGSEDYIKDGASEVIRERCIRDLAIGRKLHDRADQLDGGAS
jgi:hypothetical protein